MDINLEYIKALASNPKRNTETKDSQYNLFNL